MANTRIFYACQAVAIEPLREVKSAGASQFVPSTPGQILHGLQSVGINSSFNLEQIFELGQIQIYENIEGLPEVEITLEKVLDGYGLIYHLATVGVSSSVPSPANRAELIARSKERCNVYLGITDESYNNISQPTNVVQAEVQCTGMYINNISYTLPVDGNCTESVTLVGNHKVWGKSAKIQSLKGAWSADLTVPIDFPANNAAPYFGGVQRKENVLIRKSKLPLSIPGTNANPQLNTAHIQNISISTDLGREDILELGSRVPYARPANFPVEVTCEIEVISVAGDQINAYPDGNPDPLIFNSPNAGSNTRSEEIVIKLNDGTVFDLGKGNRLSSVNYTGGDAGGGNASVTYSYVTYNELRVIQRNDPAGATNLLNPPDFSNLQR
jgi:hypothetical protein